MAEEIASLYATIGAKNEGLKKGLSDSKGDLAGFEKELQKTATRFNSDFIGGMQRGTYTSKDFGNALLKAGDQAGLSGAELEQMASKTGLFTNKQLQAGFAARKTAEEADRLSKAVAGGKMSADEAGKAFASFGKQMGTTASATDQLKAGFTQAMSVIGAVTAGATLAVVGLKKVMEFGRAGAEIQLTEVRFDRLAASIGTTADVLKKDLSVATRGMLSDAELMTSATTMMTLGLAKTHDEAVRLTRVAGALGMNMNQLVLTLTNQTTMRFDALGVSVDGFDEKVNNLKKSGMSANDAFKEAFLQQAEGQIAKVGDAADSSAAAFVRLDVATKNLNDSLKTGIGPFLVRVAEGLTMIVSGETGVENVFKGASDKVYATAKSYDEYRDRLKAAADASWGLVDAQSGNLYISGKLVQSHYMMARAQYDLRKVGMGVTGTVLDMQAALSEQAEAQAISTEQFMNAFPALQALEIANLQAAKSAAEYAAAQEDDATAERGAMQLMDAHNARLNDMATAYMNVKGAQEQLARAQEEWGKGVGEDAAKRLKDTGLSAEDYRAALAEIDSRMGTNLGRTSDYNTKLDELIKKYDPKNPQDFGKALDDLATDFEDLSTPIDEAKKKVDDLSNAFTAISGRHFTAYVDVIATLTSATGGGSPSTEHRTPGGKGGYASGGSFIVGGVGGTDSQYVSFMATPGERVDITTSGGSPMTGGDVYIENINIEGAGKNANALVAELFRKVNAYQRSGAGRYAGR